MINVADDKHCQRPACLALMMMLLEGHTEMICLCILPIFEMSTLVMASLFFLNIVHACQFVAALILRM